MVIGGGGREHALVRALARSPRRPKVICAPGNPGIERDAEVHRGVDVTDADALVALARERAVSLAVIGPEMPLVAGVADALRAAGVLTFGPSAAAARLEGSKAFAKEIMEAAGVPTARAETITTLADGLAAVGRLGTPVAVKADGLAAGKGVVVARSAAEAREALEDCLVRDAFGAAGRAVVVEERLVGPRSRCSRSRTACGVALPGRPRLQADRREQHRAEHRRHGRGLAGAGRARRPGRELADRVHRPVSPRWRPAASSSPACSTPG